jgi:hypothetical protein
MTISINLTRFGGTEVIDITNFVFAFIASKTLSKTLAPPVYIEWDTHIDPQHGKTQLQILDSVTTNLDPGDYFWNITTRDPSGNVQTYASGTWPIIPVPGVMAGQ